MGRPSVDTISMYRHHMSCSHSLFDLHCNHELCPTAKPAWTALPLLRKTIAAPASVLRSMPACCQVCPHDHARNSDSNTAVTCSRRLLASAIVLLASSPADADQGFSRYVKKKKLDPLETYVPSILLAKQQLQDAGNVMGLDPKAARSLLRSGAFGGLRDCVRAVGQYAAIEERASNADVLATEVLQNLEAFDFILFDAAKRNKELQLSNADAKLKQATGSIDRLLATVPQSIVQQAERVAEAVNAGRVDSMSAGKAATSEQLQNLVPSQ